MTSNDLVRYKILEILFNKASLRGTDWNVKRKEMIESLPFEEKQIDFNFFYLFDKGLAKMFKHTSKNWETATITSKGIDVIEHKQNFVEELPFIQVAIQEINAPIYGNAIQAVNSTITFNQQVTDAFKQTYQTLETKKDLTPEQKTEIKKNLIILEEELKSKDKDAGKIQKLWKRIKKNASWIAPILVNIVLKGLEISIE